MILFLNCEYNKDCIPNNHFYYDLNIIFLFIVWSALKINFFSNVKVISNVCDIYNKT
jgi:hypothetical protein